MRPRAQDPAASPRSRGRLHALGAGWALAALLLPGAAAQDPGDVDLEDAEIRGFSIPSTRSAQARRLRAMEHLTAARWNEAIEDLQVLVEEHGDELVPDMSSSVDGPPVHRGAGRWASDELLVLPEEAAALYRRRFEERARAGLELARSASDRQAIVEVAERWPATDSAVAAWWSLGDLELELGNLEQARQGWGRAVARRLGRARGQLLQLDGDRRDDWERALRQLEKLDVELSEGELRRAQLALATLADENPLAEASRLRRTPHGSLRLAGPGEGAQGPPGPDASTWPRPFAIPHPHPFAPGNSGNLFPVRVGDRVFVSNSLELFAINAYSGALLWASGEAPGWDLLTPQKKADFFEGISHQDTMIAPAASERIVVAALQVPVSDLRNATFRNIAITTIIPDRRLYAFDVETGRELWNHHPPDDWDGESGSFTDRVSVAGPPVVAASRVIVPVHRMYGRIEFYVACFDLVTGEALWTSQLVSGQRELNMFARAEEEFSAPPVRVEGDRVVVLTQLGAIAVLDLFSGSILWETLYDQITPPSRNSFSAARLKNYWRNAPPVVADGVVVATPFDSKHLIGLDFETGETLWKIPHATLDHLAGQRQRDDIDLLVGADERTVFLGGWPVMALRSSGGLSREAPRELAWRYPPGEVEANESTAARALLLADRVIIPTSSERIEVDRFGGGRRHKAVPWKGGRSGNLLVEDGTLYTLTSQYLDGYFEWDMLLERGRRAYDEAGGDLDSSSYLASLIVERSRTELEAGHTQSARDWLIEAEELLLPFTGAGDTPELIGRQLHSLLRTRGRVFIDLADGPAALEALHRARQYAPDPEALRDTLVEEYVFVQGVDREAQLEILDTLAERCGRQRLAAHEVEEQDHPYGWRFEPFVPEPDERDFAEKIPVDLWTLLESAGLAAHDEDLQAELVALHLLLEEWPRAEVPAAPSGVESVRDFALRRMGLVLEVHGRTAYAPFEQAAEELLAEARKRRDRAMLELVNSLYPYSLAAREANDQLLEWATAAGAVEEVAKIALSELPERWAPELADERSLELMLHLGAAVETAGNRDYAGALYRSLVQVPGAAQRTSKSHDGRTLEQLVEEHPPAADPAPPLPAEFSTDLARDLVKQGGHRFLGEIPPGQSSDRGRVLLFTRTQGRRGSDMSFVAYSASSLAGTQPQPLWVYDIPTRDLPQRWEDRVAFIPGALVASSPDGVYALGREGGEWIWTLEWNAPPGAEVDSLVADQGLVLVTVRSRSSVARLVALEWSDGRELWSTEFDAVRFSREPLVGGDRVVVMPRRSQLMGQILDLFTGRPVADFELPVRIHQTAHEAAWIQDGLLIVPWFINGRFKNRNRIVAVDLWDGSQRWNADLSSVAGGRRELRSIVQAGGRTYLALKPNLGAEKEGVHAIFVELDTRLGAMARVGSFEREHDLRLVGIRPEKRVELESPRVYLFDFAEGTGTLRLAAFDLARRLELWTTGFDLTRDELYSTVLQRPAEGLGALALVLSQRESKFGTPLSTLYLLDDRNGAHLRQLALDSDLGTSIDIEPRALGRSLILAGEDMLEVLR